MFSRRRGHSANRASSMGSHTPVDRTTSSNAAAAASQAFLRKTTSNASLSSAAAAAALRSLTTTPEPVGNLQTKRMVRRGSITSVGSGSMVSTSRGAVPARGGLQRRDSGGSMTERTFRSPSPARSNNGAVSPAPDAPPVPAIPRKISQQQKRSSSLDPPQRVLSPTPGRGGAGRAASMDRNSMPPPANARTGGKRLSNVNEELERVDSNGRNSNDSGGRNSVNFSRPINSIPSSPISPPTDKQYTHGQGNWFSEAVPIPSKPNQTPKEAALEQKIARIQAAQGQSVRKDNRSSSAQGSYLARPSSVAYDTADTVMVYDPGSRTFISKPRERPSSAEPPSPTTLRLAAAPAAGTYDPHTRTIVPAAAPVPSVQSQRPARPTVDTADLQPPPRNPARVSPVMAASRPLLHKQPSTVREESEDGSAAGSDVGDGRTRTFTGPSKSYVTPAHKPRSSSLDIPQGSLASAAGRRGGSNTSTSPSPSRRPHFSASPVIQATRHDPPPRDLSPAKPALKNAHSPASSIRTGSPLANFSPAPKSPISETSDNNSQASQDAFAGRKKKTVKVSFDEQPLEIDPPNAVATPSSFMRPALDDVDDEDLMKPRPALPSFGSVRKQRVTPDVPEKVTEMAPERHDRSNDHAIGGILKNAGDADSAKEPAVPVAPIVISKEIADDNSSVYSEDLGEPTATSTPAHQPAIKEAKPGQLEIQQPQTKDFATAAAPALEKGEDDDVPAINLLPPTPGAEEEHKTLAGDSDQPVLKRPLSTEINVPGGWAGEEESHPQTASAGGAITTIDSIESQKPHVAAPEEPVIIASPQPIASLDAINEDNSDDDGEFSDAAEDLSEIDNGGFASLDAIAVSPVLTTSTANRAKQEAAALPESPSARQAAKKRMDKAEEEGSGDWGEATAYWSRLSQQQREQIERQHFSSDDEAETPPVRKQKKKTTAQSIAAAATPADPKPRPASTAQPGKPALKKTMRAQPEPVPVEGEVHMRRSMRGNADIDRTTSLRSNASSQQAKSAAPTGAFQRGTMRPSSAEQDSLSGLPGSGPQDSAFPRINTSAQPRPKAQPAPVMSAKLQKELANDSDSESSFKKKRRSKASADAQGRYTMKRSMRGGPVEVQPAAPVPQPTRTSLRPTSPEPSRGKGRDSFSIRSLSPTGSFFGRKKRGEEVRQSIRGSSVDAGARTLRNGSLQKTAPRQPIGSTYKSKYADSDDEEDEQPRRGLFKSRFTDSDDEDDDVFIPADLAPVRGIPRRQGQSDGDSTDLEDEEDHDDRRKASRQRQKMAVPQVPQSADVDKAMEAARKKLGIAARPTQNEADIDKAMEAARKKLGIPEPDSSQGKALTNGTLRHSTVSAEPQYRPDESLSTPEKKKRGFMGSILRRNRNSTSSVPQSTVPPASRGNSEQAVPTSPVGKVAPTLDLDLPTTPLETPGGTPNGKLVRRMSAQQPAQLPRMRRGDSTYSTATAPPMSGDTGADSNWPLPPVPKIPDHLSGADRPNTSDGAEHSVVRFDMGDEDASAGQKGAIYSRRTGKKKKFGMLRRAFGLND